MGQATVQGLPGDTKMVQSIIAAKEEMAEVSTHELDSDGEGKQSAMWLASGMITKDEVEEHGARTVQLDAAKRQAALLEYQQLREQYFPEVPDISGEELLDLVNSNAVGDSVVLVDCRSEKERQVSIYKGAITISDFEANVENLKCKQIVAYCAIGRRSGLFLRKLMLTYPGIRVRNHAGSVVDWTHVGGPFVDERSGAATNRVHPNGTWLPYLPFNKNLQVVIE